MKEILVDTDVLVSFLTDRNESQQRRAAALLRGATEREHTLAVHSMAIVETVHVLVQLYDADPLAVSQAMRKLLATPGVITVSDVPWSVVLESWPELIPSFGDAILVGVASEGRHDAVATFDLGLRKELSRQGCISYWPD
jgi:predicted nucleic acid-binding protein